MSNKHSDRCKVLLRRCLYLCLESRTVPSGEAALEGPELAAPVPAGRSGHVRLHCGEEGGFDAEKSILLF